MLSNQLTTINLYSTLPIKSKIVQVFVNAHQCYLQFHQTTNQNKNQLLVSRFMNQLSKESHGSGLTKQLVLYTPQVKVNNYCEIVNKQQPEQNIKISHEESAIEKLISQHQLLKSNSSHASSSSCHCYGIRRVGGGSPKEEKQSSRKFICPQIVKHFNLFCMNQVSMFYSK